MSQIYKLPLVFEPQPEGGYVATCPLLPELITESDQDKPGVILDYDTNGNLVSLEITDASKGVNIPSKIEYQVSPVAE